MEVPWYVIVLFALYFGGAFGFVNAIAKKYEVHTPIKKIALAIAMVWGFWCLTCQLLSLFIINRICPPRIDAVFSKDDEEEDEHLPSTSLRRRKNAEKPCQKMKMPSFITS